jgi:hypothetical protein
MDYIKFVHYKRLTTRMFNALQVLDLQARGLTFTCLTFYSDKSASVANKEIGCARTAVPTCDGHDIVRTHGFQYIFDLSFHPPFRRHQSFSNRHEIRLHPSP